MATRRLAYLFPTFPVLHQTFTLGEVLGLEEAGYDLVLVSLKRTGAGLQQPGARCVVERTIYCPPLFSRPMVAACARALRIRPRDLFRLFADVVRAWRVRVPERTAPGGDDDTTMGWKEKLRGVYHCNRWVYLAKSLIMVPFAIFIADVFERERIGHVHAHWATYPATVAWLIRRWSGIAYSFTAHAYDIHMVQQMLPSKIEDAEFVVTCAEVNRRFLRALCPTPAADRIHVNYHGTDLDRFVPRRHANADRAGFRVVGCGSLEEYKGFHYLLDAIALMADGGVDVSCELAGDGPQRSFLQARAKRLGIERRVSFRGFVDQAALAEIYSRADAFAMPSVCLGRYGKQDVIPNVLAEAMACGVPVVGSDIAGIPELIEDGRSGLLVPERDAHSLAAALKCLNEDTELARRLSKEGLAKVRSIWDRRNNVRELARLIDVFVDAPGTYVQGKCADAASRVNLGAVR